VAVDAKNKRSSARRCTGNTFRKVKRWTGEEVDVPPGRGGDFLQQLDCFLVAGGLVALQQFRKQDEIVGDDDVGDQPGAQPPLGADAEAVAHDQHAVWSRA
jgi:hypothetical protein